MTVAGESVPHPPGHFFVTGGTLQGDAASYITRQAYSDLFTSLLAGEYCYVLNSRQMGKSSLMVRTAERLKAEGATVADIDLTGIGQNLMPEQWYDGLLTRLSHKLDCEDALESFISENTRLSPFQRWQESLIRIVLPGIRGRLVIFVDEIDVVRSLPFSADEFFAGIRQFYVGRATDLDNVLAFVPIPGRDGTEAGIPVRRLVLTRPSLLSARASGATLHAGPHRAARARRGRETARFAHHHPGCLALRSRAVQAKGNRLLAAACPHLDC